MDEAKFRAVAKAMAERMRLSPERAGELPVELAFAVGLAMVSAGGELRSRGVQGETKCYFR